MSDKSSVEPKVTRKADDSQEKFDIASHIKALEDYYNDPMGAKNFLGIAKDTRFKYRWVHINNPRKMNRLHQMTSIGWTPAKLEEVDFDQRNLAANRFGSDVVIVEHGNGDLMQLIKIPIELHALNQEYKSKKASQKPLYDKNGRPTLGSNYNSKEKIVSDPNTGQTTIYREDIDIG